MTLKERLYEAMGSPDYTLTEGEYWAVYEWIDKEKDGLPGELKEGLLKLINGEMHRRMD
jgi:hypothetical protein